MTAIYEGACWNCLLFFDLKNAPLGAVSGVRVKIYQRGDASEAIMSLIGFCKKGDLEGVKGALQSGVDVNTKSENGETGLMWAVDENHNSVVELLLNTPNIDVNLKSVWGSCALHDAVRCNNNEGLKQLLKIPNIDVDIVNIDGRNALHWAVREINIEALKLLLGHPSLTTLTLNQKDKKYDATPVMLAVIMNRLEHLDLLIADPGVDLDTTDWKGRSLEEVAR